MSFTLRFLPLFLLLLPACNSSTSGQTGTAPSSGVLVPSLAPASNATDFVQRLGDFRFVAQFPGADWGEKINNANADCPSDQSRKTAGCTVILPTGVLNFSTQIRPTKPMVLMGQGCALANTGYNCATVLNWTGNLATADGGAILIDNGGATGTRIMRLGLNNSGSAPAGIEINWPAAMLRLEDVVCDKPLVPFSLAGIQVGSSFPDRNRNVAEVTLMHVSLRKSAPIGLWVVHSAGQMHTFNSRFLQHSAHEIVLGEVGVGASVDQKFFGTTVESLSGLGAIKIINTKSMVFSGGYIEFKGGYAVSIPADAASAEGITFEGNIISAQNDGAASGIIDSQKATTTLNLIGNTIVEGSNGFVPGWNLLNNDGGAAFTLLGNTANTAHAMGPVAGGIQGSIRVTEFGQSSQNTLLNSSNFAQPVSFAQPITVAAVKATGTGLKHLRITGGLGGSCPSAATVGATCTSAELAWPGGAFSSANYTATCTLNTVSGLPTIVSIVKTASFIKVVIAALTATPVNANVDCIGIHE